MKDLILILIMFFVFISKNIKSENTVEYITEGSDTTDIKSFKLSNGSEFSTFESKGSWTDNFGNYGRNSCKGIIDKGINKNVSLIVMCESIDKNGFKTWTLNKRDGELDGGVGSNEIVDTTIPKKNLYIGTKCKFAIKYLDEMNFYKNKCKISKELAKVFEKMSR